MLKVETMYILDRETTDVSSDISLHDMEKQDILKDHIAKNHEVYYGYLYLEYNNEVILDKEYSNSLDVYWGYFLNYCIYEVIENGYISDFISGESEPYTLVLTENTVDFTIRDKTYHLPRYEFLKTLLEEGKRFYELYYLASSVKDDRIPIVLINELLTKIEHFK
ncbi:hypothetical protein [Caldalkalibacillus mannanilyticus]|uniref:hypothetical protein n=1 Tax=Caldalkalibacillus mannanilyticus TaxID=1418 RepID=UPI00046A417A|nr:hypothetical protein [Caldalkalibacillus mannanilyticus]